VTGFSAAHLDEIPPRNTWIPIRDHLGIGSFGVNAYRAENAGDNVITDHVETLSNHEELYVVVDGHATFTVDGNEIDAPTGTLVFVDPETRRSAVANQPGTTVLVAGATPGKVFEISPWEETWEPNQEAMKLYREERYGEAADVLRDALESYPDAAGLYYNLACFDSLAGADVAAVAGSLGRAIELYPGFREFARGDSDFDPVREEPAIRELVGEPR
jgi:mannose-6-phosphate isomerase-like protein (cupin superfamily)